MKIKFWIQKSTIEPLYMIDPRKCAKEGPKQHTLNKYS
jgi:hypothetical protein